MKKMLLPVFAVAMLFSAACQKIKSNDLKDEVGWYQFYTIEYDKTANITNAQASFRIRGSDGPTIKLNKGAVIKLNGIEYTGHSSDKTVYHWEMSGMPDADFELTKNNGVKITNTIARTELGDIEFVNVPANLSTSGDYKFSWKESGFQSGEGITIDVYNEATSIASFNDQVKDVTIRKERMKGWPRGKATLRITRKKTMSLKNNDGDAGGNINLSLSVEKEIDIKD